MSAAPDGRAATILTRVGALKQTKKINDKLDDILDDLLVAWRGRIWEALDLPSWESYIETHVPRVANLKLSIDTRRDAVAHWATFGAPQRDMAAAFNVSRGLVAADAKVVVPFDPEARTISRDGSSRARRILTAVPAPAPRVSFRDKLVFAIADAGTKGMTRKELCRQFKADGGAVSGALTPLHKSGRIVRTTDVRNDCYVYVVAPEEA